MAASGVYAFPAIERVIFGTEAETAIAAEAERLGAARVFLLVSETLDRTTDRIRRVREALGTRYAGSHSGMPAHTPRDAVIRATDAARAAGTDLLVTFGGGSLTDAGKAMRLCLELDIRDADAMDPYREIVSADGKRTTPQFAAPRVDQIAVPTTLSAGEFGAGAGVTDTKRGAKQLFRHPRFVPRSIVLDPRATLATPTWLWLSTGIRALDHAVETLCSPFGHPQSDGPAMHALRLLTRGLPRTVADPDDLAARLDCQLAAWASMDHHACNVPMGCSHGIGHVLGGTCNVPHGYTSCVMLPAVLRYNRDANAERQAMVSEAMGRPGAEAADVVGDFIASLGMPRRLADVGVGPERFEEVAQKSMHDRYIYSNPRPISGPAEIMDILRMAA